MSDNIKEAAKEAKSNIKTSHLVCIQEEYYPNRDINLNNYVTAETKKIRQINKRTIVELDTIIESAREKGKMVCSDLRDIPALLKSNNLKPHFKMELSRDRINLVKGTYEMGYIPPGDEEPGQPNNAVIMLYGEKGQTDHILNLPYFGIIDVNLLDERYSPVISEKSQDGQNLIQINISFKTPGGFMLGVIQCDPQVQYRFRSIVWSNDKGEKKTEVIANDYRNINGFPYPFLYVYRQFVNGELDREEKYSFQKVQFNISLNGLDFKMLVPKMTPIVDSAISHKVTIIEQERYLGIEDVLEICRNMTQNQ